MSRALMRTWPTDWKTIGLLSREQCKRETLHFEKCCFFSLPGSNSSKRKEYVAEKLVGFTKDEMFMVVSDVVNYKKFVPFCRKSDVVYETDDYLLGRLEIGFPPLAESYTSRVTMKRPELVRADCTNGKLFDHLITTWKFGDGLKDKERSSDMFFKELVREMEKAFITEAGKRFGSPTFPTIHVKSGIV